MSDIDDISRMLDNINIGFEIIHFLGSEAEPGTMTLVTLNYLPNDLGNVFVRLYYFFDKNGILLDIAIVE
jgi:hypothetical protein